MLDRDRPSPIAAHASGILHRPGTGLRRSPLYGLLRHQIAPDFARHEVCSRLALRREKELAAFLQARTKAEGRDKKS